jgi:hypothetical protein
VIQAIIFPALIIGGFSLLSGHLIAVKTQAAEP